MAYGKRSRWGQTPAQAKKAKAVKAARSIERALYAAKNIRTGGYVGKELKYFDTEHSQIALSNTFGPSAEFSGPRGTIFCPVNGSGVNERVGRECTIQSIHVRGVLYIESESFTPSNPAPDAYFTVWLVEDRQTNSAGLDTSQVFKDVGSSSLRTMVYNNIENSHRYRVLKKKNVRIKRDLTTYVDTTPSLRIGGSGATAYFDMNWKGKITVKFNGSSLPNGNVADVNNSSIHIIAIRNNGFGDLNELFLNSRVRFVG